MKNVLALYKKEINARRNSENGDLMGNIILFSPVVAVAILITNFLATGIANKQKKLLATLTNDTKQNSQNSTPVNHNPMNNNSTNTTTPNNTSAITPNNHASDNATSLHPITLLEIGGVILGIIILLTLAYVAKEYAKGKRAIIAANNENKLEEFKRAAALSKQLTEDWNNTLNIHDHILMEWNAYDKNIKKLLELPAMRDFSLPEIGKVIDALDQAADYRSVSYPKGTTNVHTTKYGIAVKTCEKAYEDALHAATIAKNKTMSRSERKQLELANQLLKTA